MGSMHVPAQLRESLEEAQQQLQSVYGNRLRHMILYGSQARGDVHPDSDIDVLVVLDEMPNPYEEIKRTTDIQIELFERYRKHFSFNPYAETEYRALRRPFLQNVRDEGIDLLSA